MQGNDIERLDYSKPPPGYTVHVLAGPSGVNSRGETRVVPSQYATMPPATPLKCGRDFDWYSTQEESTAAAWAHYKAHNDPPGFVLTHDHEYEESCHLWFAEVGFGGPGPTREGAATQAEARAAAWAWHDRRHKVANLAVGYGDSELWPRALAWSDPELAQVIGYVRGDKLALSELQRLGVVRG